MAEISIQGVSVAIGMPCYGPMPTKTAMSLAKTAMACGQYQVPLSIIMEGCTDVVMSRNYVVREFLTLDSQKLFWIDSDMVWEPDLFFRFLALSTVEDVVCATYRDRRKGVFHAQIPADPKHGQFGMVECTGSGLGFTVVDRKVIDELDAKYPKKRDPMDETMVPQVFQTGLTPDVLDTEDFAFFDRVRQTGRTVWLYPDATLGHLGEQMRVGNFAKDRE